MPARNVIDWLFGLLMRLRRCSAKVGTADIATVDTPHVSEKRIASPSSVVKNPG
jgi:hypothetical protein